MAAQHTEGKIRKSSAAGQPSARYGRSELRDLLVRYVKSKDDRLFYKIAERFRGKRGRRGRCGDPGKPGDDGEDGPKGDDGPRGADGSSSVFVPASGSANRDEQTFGSGGFAKWDLNLTDEPPLVNVTYSGSDSSFTPTLPGVYAVTFGAYKPPTETPQILLNFIAVDDALIPSSNVALFNGFDRSDVMSRKIFVPVINTSTRIAIVSVIVTPQPSPFTLLRLTATIYRVSELPSLLFHKFIKAPKPTLMTRASHVYVKQRIQSTKNHGKTLLKKEKKRACN